MKDVKSEPEEREKRVGSELLLRVNNCQGQRSSIALILFRLYLWHVTVGPLPLCAGSAAQLRHSLSPAVAACHASPPRPLAGPGAGYLEGDENAVKFTKR